MAEAVARKRRRRLKTEEEEFEEEDMEVEDTWDDEDEDYEEEEEVEEVKPARKKKKVSTSKASVKKKSNPLTQALAVVPKLEDIFDEMNANVFEREYVIKDILRALIAGENILFLGPPGTGKSMLADLFASHVEQVRTFKWLMNRTTDPADLVGPYSVKGMENDKFLRITTGKLPEAHVGFLDEIFKSNEPSLNYLLSMLNEGIFYNDGKAVPVELRIVMGASNEYPEDEGLEAFYDRFMFRHWIEYIQDPQNRIKMVTSGRAAKKKGVLPKTTITLDEIDLLQEAVHMVDFPARIAKDFERLIRTLGTHNMVVSDRRYFKAQLIMMANALLEGRDTVNGSDFTALRNVLWNKDRKELELLDKELGKFMNPHESKMKEFVKKAEELMKSTMDIENRTERAGTAVQTNSSLTEMLDKMNDEFKEAERNGASEAELDKLDTYLVKVEEIMNEVSTKCLRQTNRKSSRQWG